MPDEVKCGIYLIEQVGTDRSYVGSSINIAKRWWMHRNRLGLGKHHCEYLQRAWAKHGAAAFAFRIIEECGADELEAREQAYIDQLKPAFNAIIDVCRMNLRPELEAKRVAKLRALAAARLCCRRGHNWSENVVIDKRGVRTCGACRKLQSARRKAKYASEGEEGRQKRAAEKKASYYRNRKGPGREAGVSEVTRQKIRNTFLSKITHCKHGHPFDEANTKWAYGKRICRACRKALKVKLREAETPEQKAHRLELKRQSWHRHGDANRDRQNRRYRESVQAA